MQRTPPSTSAATQPTISDQNAKRSRMESSPEMTIAPQDLISVITNTINSNLDEKLKLLPTKKDLDEIKVEISGIGSEISNLREENKQLKDELSKVKREYEESKKDMMWIQQQIKTTKVFIRGLNSSREPATEVSNMLKSKLEITPSLSSVRKIFDRNGKMGVIVEFESTQVVENVLRNTKKLTGTAIYIERDLIPTKQLLKRVSLHLKAKILTVSKAHKVVVREDRIKVKDTWFAWNSDRKLLSGKADGKAELLKIYGDCITNINTDFEQLLEEMSSKN